MRNPLWLPIHLQDFAQSSQSRPLTTYGRGYIPQAYIRAGAGIPKGAIIRTILRDYAPEELAGGATLFHEHRQLKFLPGTK